MRVLKPQCLSVLHRCFERQRRAYLGVAVVGFVPLGEEPALLPEQELWQLVPPLLGDTPLDAAMPKYGAEFLVSGDACAPGGEPVAGLETRVRLGGLSKTLHVFGTRRWEGRAFSQPEPFVRMPMGWEQAYGGPDFELNRQGRGRAPVTTAAGRVHELPQVEYPAQPSVAPNQAIAPASFGPLGPMSPQRKRFDGSYDAAWMQQDFPGTPADLDWRYFCVGSEDQWQSCAFSGDETLELVHLHPDRPRITGRLPGVCPVVVVRDKGMAVGMGRFLECRLSTVWFFPNQLRAALIWHALMPVADEFADQVELMCVGAEWLGQPRPREQHYLQAISERLDEEHGALRTLDDTDLLPAGLAVPNESLARFEALLKSSGIGLQRHQDKLRSETERLESELQSVLGEQALAEARQRQAEALVALQAPDLSAGLPGDTRSLIAWARRPSLQRGAALEQLQQQARDGVLDDVHQVLSGAGFETSVLAPFRDRLAGGPGAGQPLPSLTQLLRDVERPLSELPAPHAGQLAPASPITTEMRERAAQADAKMQPLWRAAAHVRETPPPVDAGTAERWRHSAAQLKAQGKSFAGLTLLGADFRQMDLSGADFSGATLDGADFSGAGLAGACFDRASLAHARFVQARLQGASFAEANLGKSDLSRALCLQNSFRGANLTQAVLAQAQLDESVFEGASLLETDLSGVRLVSARLDHLVLLRCRLGAASLVGAHLNKTSFIECEAAGAVFAQAGLASADFVNCRLDGAVFDGAEADNVRFVHHCSLVKASFRGAVMRRASLRGLALEGADFQRCRLDGADLGDSRCAGADFSRASLSEALLAKAGLQGCRFVAANLMRAILQHAQLQRADLRDSNLFAVDLARIDSDEHTRWERAYTAKVRTLPALKVLPPGSGPA
ncbi:DUF2169 domain-containing protein [Aquabacterium sp. A7-Y]|uniref:DUF2169 family type VI secretion system accessory protein n=1 Tax=Aquabacterium sp. A7-Y TaxID=1349605 RepID=UPI00223D4DD5|nr:DUF2169 domain-containing protein [Aquabacterium sp. A7-Y]MCW7541342.1 DUF2169 domain-containing protein [Aquabacterium sp. A7-Y]